MAAMDLSLRSFHSQNFLKVRHSFDFFNFAIFDKRDAKISNTRVYA